MNLEKLFKIQANLDRRIVEQHGLQDQDLLDKKILALQVELGELANEQRSWKFWSKDQEPRRIKRYLRNDGTFYYTYPLLEEYVDCLHFILSIGLEMGFENEAVGMEIKLINITEQFNALFDKVGDFNNIRNVHYYMSIISLFIALGEMLGFTTNQIIDAYMAKNEVNYTRQESNY